MSTEQALEFIGGPLDGNKTTDTPDQICIYMTGHGTDGRNRHARYDLLAYGNVNTSQTAKSCKEE